MFDWKNHRACGLEGPEGFFVVVRPHVFEEHLRWYWDQSVRALPIERVLVDEPDRFEFETDDGRTYSLAPMTVRDWDEHLRPELGGPAFKSDEEVQAYVLADYGFPVS